MQEKRLAGLLKFFDRDDYIADLLAGLVYFNTPECYRLACKEGRADLHESCAFSFRKDRGDAPVQVTFAGQEIKEILTLTMHNAGRKQGWLHCWSAVLLPASLDELQQLSTDINRIREEFGRKYVFLPGSHVNCFAERIQRELLTASNNAVHHGLVQYSASKDEWGVWCKSTAYAYQREYRFVVGECGHTDITPKPIRCPGGFTDILHTDGVLKVHGDKGDDVLMALDKNGCRLMAGVSTADAEVADYG